MLDLAACADLKWCEPKALSLYTLFIGEFKTRRSECHPPCHPTLLGTDRLPARSCVPLRVMKTFLR